MWCKIIIIWVGQSIHHLLLPPISLPYMCVKKASIKTEWSSHLQKWKSSMDIPTFKDGNPHDLWAYFNPYYFVVLVTHNHPNTCPDQSWPLWPRPKRHLRVKCGGFTRQTITTLDELVNVNTIRTITWVRFGLSRWVGWCVGMMGWCWICRVEWVGLDVECVGFGCLFVSVLGCRFHPMQIVDSLKVGRFPPEIIKLTVAVGPNGYTPTYWPFDWPFGGYATHHPDSEGSNSMVMGHTPQLVKSFCLMVQIIQLLSIVFVIESLSWNMLVKLDSQSPHISQILKPPPRVGFHWEESSRNKHKPSTNELKVLENFRCKVSFTKSCFFNSRWKCLEDLVTLQPFLTASCRRGAIQQPEECPGQAPKKGNQQISSISWPVSHHHSSGNHPRMSETNQGKFILLYVCLPVVKQGFQPGNWSSPKMPKASKISPFHPCWVKRRSWRRWHPTSRYWNMRLPPRDSLAFYTFGSASRRRVTFLPNG